MKDFLNQDIKIGDTIVYPNRQGSSLWMNQARVEEVRIDSLKVRRSDGSVKTIHRTDRVVVVTEQLVQMATLQLN